MFYFKSFIVLGFSFRSMIHFELILVYDANYGMKYVLKNFVYAYSGVSASFVERTILSSVMALEH